MIFGEGVSWSRDAADRLWLAAGRFAVRAERRDDRWEFVLGQWDDGGCFRRRLVQLPPDWPEIPAAAANPVFQEAEPRQAAADRAELLLTGLCGRRHFSGVLAVDADGATLEVADRSPAGQTPEKVGFAYWAAAETLLLPLAGPAMLAMASNQSGPLQHLFASPPAGGGPTLRYGWRWPFGECRSPH